MSPSDLARPLHRSCQRSARPNIGRRDENRLKHCGRARRIGPESEELAPLVQADASAEAARLLAPAGVPPAGYTRSGGPLAAERGSLGAATESERATPCLAPRSAHGAHRGCPPAAGARYPTARDGDVPLGRGPVVVQCVLERSDASRWHGTR